MTQVANLPNWITTVSRQEGKVVVKLFLLDKKNRKVEHELNVADFYDKELRNYFAEVAKSISTAVNGYFLVKDGKAEKK